MEPTPSMLALRRTLGSMIDANISLLNYSEGLGTGAPALWMQPNPSLLRIR